MNTIILQLNERQLADLTELLDEGLDTISSKLSSREAEHYTQADREEITRLCGEGVGEIRRSIENRSYYWQSSTYDLNLEIPAAAVDPISQLSYSQDACKVWLDRDHPNYLQAQINRWGQDDLDVATEYVADSGVDGIEDMSDEEVIMHVLWMACHDIKEEMAND